MSLWNNYYIDSQDWLNALNQIGIHPGDTTTQEMEQITLNDGRVALGVPDEMWAVRSSWLTPDQLAHVNSIGLVSQTTLVSENLITLPQGKG